MLWKKIILKGNITARYTEYKHHNNETTCTSVSTSRFNEQQYSNSSTKSWKTVSIKSSFGLPVEILSQFSRLIWFNLLLNKVFTSFILGKNL